MVVLTFTVPDNRQVLGYSVIFQHVPGQMEKKFYSKGACLFMNLIVFRAIVLPILQPLLLRKGSTVVVGCAVGWQ